MIGLALIGIILISVIVFSLAVIVGGMIWTGRIAIPGSQAHRLNNARVAEQISKHEELIAARKANIAQQELLAAQAEANRRVLEAKSVDELQEMWDTRFQRELEAGK